MGRKPRAEIICKCNQVDRPTIEKAITSGCKSLNDIFDATTAGVGPCGGSCRRKLAPLLRHYLSTGTFPEKIVEDPRMPSREELSQAPSTEPLKKKQSE